MGDVLLVRGLPVCSAGGVTSPGPLLRTLRVPRMPLRYRPSEEETAREEAVAQAALVRVASLCYDNIALSPKLKAFVQREVKRRGYASVSEYVRELIRGEQVRQDLSRLEAEIIKGI